MSDPRIIHKKSHGKTRQQRRKKFQRKFLPQLLGYRINSPRPKDTAEYSLSPKMVSIATAQRFSIYLRALDTHMNNINPATVNVLDTPKHSVTNTITSNTRATTNKHPRWYPLQSLDIL